MTLSAFIIIASVAFAVAVAARRLVIVAAGEMPSREKRSALETRATARAKALDVLRKAGTITELNEEERVKTRLELARAGIELDPVTWRGIRVACVGGAIAFIALVSATLHLEGVPFAFVIALCALAGIGGPSLYLATKKRSRRKALGSDLPSALELLNTSVRAGYTLERGIRLIGTSTQGALAREFQRVDREINLLSMPLDRALLRMKERCDTPAISSFVNAMVQAHRQGTSVSRALNSQAKAARSQHFADTLVTINQLPNKMVPVIFLVFFPIIIALATVPVVYNAIVSFTAVF